MKRNYILRLSLALNVVAFLLAIVVIIKFGDRILEKIASYESNKMTTYKIAVLGDSRVEWGNWSKGLERNDVKNCGIGGITVSLYRSELDGIFKLQPKICILQIGINDLRINANVDSTVLYFNQIIDSLLSRNIVPIITSVIPLRKDFTQDEPSEITVNNRTDSLNNKLIHLCAKRNIKYLDINTNICEENRLKVEFTQDGIHLNEEGYGLIFEQIKLYLIQIEG